MLLTMFGNPSAALAAPAAAAAAGFAIPILTHWFSCMPFMVFAPNELTVVSAFIGLDMPSSPRIPFDANIEPVPTRVVGVVPRPKKLSMLDSPEVDDVDAAVDALEASGEASD
jgi:hypothetical protein